MSVVASVLSIVLFLVFAASGMQKIRFNPMMSSAAEHLGFSKVAYQRIGFLEFVGAVVGLAVTMIGAVYFHLRKGDAFAVFAPAGALTVLSILELIFRLG